MTLKKRWRSRLEEKIFVGLMVLSTILVLGVLLFIIGVVFWRGIKYLDLDMITQTPQGGFYLGEEGGILNAIVGSLVLAGGATLLALVVALPLSIYLRVYVNKSRFAQIARLSLDILWGIPSIVYGAFGFIIMLWIGLRASLLGGIITLAILELPILVRAMDEVIGMVPKELNESSYALGATSLETGMKVVIRQAMPGLLTAVLLAFGRGIGDAASVLFTAGYTDRLPTSLFSPVATLPLAVFFQLGTPFPAVQGRAYASALILTVIILVISLSTRLLSRRFTKHLIK